MSKDKPRIGIPKTALAGNKALDTLSLQENFRLSRREIDRVQDVSQKSVVNLLKKKHPSLMKLTEMPKLVKRTNYTQDYGYTPN